MKIFKKIISTISILSVMFLNNSHVFATDKIMKICFIGNLASGKTALRSEATFNKFDYELRNVTSKTTFMFYNLRYFDRDIECRLYDTSGNKKFRNDIITKRLNGAHIAVITLDASNSAEQEADEVLELCFNDWIEEVKKAQNLKTKIIVAVTKSEFLNQSYKNELIDKLESLKRYHSKCRIDYVFTSAKRKQGIGNPKDSVDTGDNFWGKIRKMIADANLYDSLYDIGSPQDAEGDYDGETGGCVLL